MKKFKATHVIRKVKYTYIFAPCTVLKVLPRFRLDVTTHMKASKQYFPARMFIAPTFEFVDEIVNCDHSNESNREVLSFGVLKCEGY